MTEATDSRLTGLFLFTLGGGLTGWTWYSGHGEGGYSLKMAVLGPVVVAFGIECIIHAPKIPLTDMSPRDGLYALLGAAAGALLLYDLGAFAPGSGSRGEAQFLSLAFAAVGVWPMLTWLARR